MIELLLASTGVYKLYEWIRGKSGPDWTLEDARTGLLDLAKKYNEDSEKIKTEMGRFAEALRDQKQDIDSIQSDVREKIKAELERFADSVSKQRQDIDSIQTGLRDLDAKMRLIQDGTARHHRWSIAIAVVSIVAIILGIVDLVVTLVH